MSFVPSIRECLAAWREFAGLQPHDVGQHDVAALYRLAGHMAHWLRGGTGSAPSVVRADDTPKGTAGASSRPATAMETAHRSAGRSARDDAKHAGGPAVPGGLEPAARVKTAAELRRDAAHDTSCVGAFARARPERLTPPPAPPTPAPAPQRAKPARKKPAVDERTRIRRALDNLIPR